jgi:hypothetical protein
MANTDARVVITAEDRATRVLKGIRGSIDGAVAAFGQLGAAGAALGAGAALAGLRSLVSSIDDLDEAAQGLGITAVQLSNLRQAAGEAGIGAEAFGTALTRLNVRIGEAATGNEDAIRLFRALGVAVSDAGGAIRPADQVLRDLAARFASLEDGPAKAALAVEVFGKAGAKLIPLLNQGADGLERFSGLTDETVKQAARLQGELDKLSASWERLKFTIAEQAVPAVNRFFDILRGIDWGAVGGPNAPWRKNGEFGGGLRALASEFKRSSERVEQLRQALKLGEGAYSNEGRAALQSAQAVLQNARAKDVATKATVKQVDAQRQLLTEYANNVAILRDAQRLQREIDQAVAEREQRLANLTGRSAAEQQARDLQLIDDALIEGTISLQEYDAAYTRIFGLNSEVSQGIEKQKDGLEGLALTFASSVGAFIERGGSVRSFFEALLQDILKLTTQLLIVKPLAEALKAAFSGGGGGVGGSISSLFAGFFADGGFIPPGRFGVVGERGPELAFGGRSGQTISPMGGPTININLPPGSNVTRQTANQIAGAVSRQLAIANRRNG